MENVNGTKFCKHCGSQIPIAAAVCPYCGYRLEATTYRVASPAPSNAAPQKKKFCKNCGAQISANAISCASCGHQVEGTIQSPPQVVINQTAPISQLKTSRGLAKYILLSFLTLGIYGLIAIAHISEETNIVCSRYDGKKTMNFWLLTFIVAPLTCGIAIFVWYHNLCGRIGKEIARRGLNYKFGASDFWLWCILGSLIIVGPFVFFHKLFKATNTLNADFNARG